MYFFEIHFHIYIICSYNSSQKLFRKILKHTRTHIHHTEMHLKKIMNASTQFVSFCFISICFPQLVDYLLCTVNGGGCN